ncbi:hypothetical protein JCM11641_007719 [Rhodosporidiobolus odoratus]
MLVYTLLYAALTALPTLSAPQQIPLSLSNPSISLLTSLSPTSLAPALSLTLAQLPREHLKQLEQHVLSLPEKRLIQLARDGSDGNRIEVTEGGKALLTLRGHKFVDVTDDDEKTMSVYSGNTYPAELNHTAKELAPLFKHISLDKMKSFIAEFSGFYNRYYRSEYGRQSQQWLLSQLKSLHKEHNPSASITYAEFKHSTWDQRSIIVHWAPSSAVAGPLAKSKKPEPSIVILSAHQDSTNRLPFLRAPGADDDGSGTTALMQTFIALLTSRWEPKEHALEFHFYSAEEGGLLGSGEVARAYKEEGRKVRGMYHMDVVAYVKPGTTPVVGLLTDEDATEAALVDFLELVIGEYAEIPAARTKCGYSCSDHARWKQNGFPSACLAEGKFEDSNPNMHSTADVYDRPEYSFEHISQFVRVGLGFVVELVGGLEKEAV